jgi:hypothetical protein
MMHKDHIACPVCKKGILPHAMRMHIQKAATMEAVREMIKIVNDAPGCTVQVDTGAVLKRCRHWDYYKVMGEPQKHRTINL